MMGCEDQAPWWVGILAVLGIGPGLAVLEVAVRLVFAAGWRIESALTGRR